MVAKPSNQDLQQQIIEVDKKVERRHKSVMSTVAKAKDELMNAIRPLTEYVNSQKTIETYIKEHPTPASIRSGGKFNKVRVTELLIQALISALAIIATLVGTGAIDGR